MKHDTTPRRMSRSPVVLTCWLGLVLYFGLATLGEAAVEGVPCTPEPTDMVISYGDLVTCSIDVTGDTDVFRFLGSNGENVVLLVTSQGSLRPCMELVAPDNTSTVECGNAFSQLIDTTLNLTGTYTVLVSASSFSGAYALALERVAPPSFSARPIQYDDTVEDEVNPTGDIDLFSFEGTQGDTVDLLVTSQGSLRPCMELVAPDNTRTVECGNAFSQQIDTTLNLTGTYTVLVSASSFSGAYALALQCLAGPCVDDAPTPDISGCIKLKGSPLANREVRLLQRGEPIQRTTTDVNGCYEFENAVSGKNFRVIILGHRVP